MQKLFTLFFCFGIFCKSFSQTPKSSLFTAIALVNDCFDAQSLQNKSIKIGSRVGNIITLRSPTDQSELLKNHPGIVYVKKASKISPNLARVTSDLRADSVYKQHGLMQGYSGKDVIIGITDWGFDYTHPMFYDTSLEHTRILAAWDQFKTSGPHPDGYSYGTEYSGEAELFTAEKDTFNIYQYATHGSHVAGIAGGSGAGTEHRGVAFEANFLFVTFLVDEAAVLDAFAWMKKQATFYNKPLVINMSWGLYHLGTLDGTSLLSQAIDQYSEQGVVFITSGGNNGDEMFHIKNVFNTDTMRSHVGFYSYLSHAEMWGQSISMWGEPGSTFSSSFEVYDNTKTLVAESPSFSTLGTENYTESFILVGTDTVFYNIKTVESFSLNQRPHMRLRVKNTNTQLHVVLKSFANSGTVHFWNLVELNNDVGNWGLSFTAWKPGWVGGDNLYGIGEPACTKSAISVAAHSSEFKAPNGNIVGGQIASFSSIGPTLDGRLKPDISAPGVNVASSVSSFTSRGFTLLENASFKGKDYPFSRFSGTSMSSPATAGVVALMLQANPRLSAKEIKEILINTARTDNRTNTIPDTGSYTWGWGKVNAYQAVLEAESMRQPVSESFLVFPNPTQSTLYYMGADGKTYDADIYARTGQKMANGQIGKSTAFDLSKYSPGLYFIRIKDSETRVFSFIINP
jgi:subtilisin family serine protease